MASYYRYQSPKYSIDFRNSVYTSHEYKRNEHIFTVEQGTQFYLKLNVNANPMPTDDDLYKDGHLVPYSPQGTIDCGIDYMEIESVECSDAGKYKISSKNRAGEGHISFRLKVKAKPAYKQRVDSDEDDEDDDPSVVW